MTAMACCAGQAWVRNLAAADAGSVGASHLSRLFVKHYDCSPGIYRLRGK